MNTQTFNIRYIIVQHSEAGYSQLKARKQSCHYLITENGKQITVHEPTPLDGTIIIAVAAFANTENIGRTDKQNETLFRTLALLSNQLPQAKIKGAEELFGYSTKRSEFEVRSFLKGKAA